MALMRKAMTKVVGFPPPCSLQVLGHDQALAYVRGLLL